MGENARDREHLHKGERRRGYAILAEMELLEVDEGGYIFSCSRTVEREKLSQRLRSPGILDTPPSLHAGYECCATCAFAHFLTSFPNWRRGFTRTKDHE